MPLPDQSSNSLSRSAVRSGAFAASSWFLRYGVTLAGAVVLRRFIGPEAYGIVAFAAVMLDFVTRISNWGLDEALLHRRDSEEAVANAHFAWQMRLTGLAVAVAIATAIIARRAGATIEPLHILIVLALVEAAHAAGGTPRVLLEKALRFKALSMVESLATLASYASAILCAWRWPAYGIWILAGQRGLEVLVRTISFWCLSPLRVSHEVDRAISRWLFFEFGWPLWLGGVCFVLTFRLPEYLVGQWHGLATLGIYFTALRLATLPRDLAAFLPRVLMPTYSRLQNDPAAMASVFEKVQSVLVRLSVLVVAFMAVSMPDLLTLFGLSPEWDDVVFLFRTLAVFAIAYAVFVPIPSLAVVGLGMPKLQLMVQVFQAAWVVLAGSVLIRFFSATGAAVAMNGMMLLSTAALWWLVHRQVPMRSIRVLLPPVVAGALATAAALYLGALLRELAVGWRVVSLGLCVLTVYLALLAAYEARRLFETGRDFLGLILERNGGGE